MLTYRLFLKFLFFIFLSLILAGIAIWFYLAMLSAMRDIIPEYLPWATVYGIAHGLLFVTTACSWILALSFPVLLVAAFWYGRHLFGSTTLSRLIGLTIVTLIVPSNWIYSFINGVLEWVQEVLWRVPGTDISGDFAQTEGEPVSFPETLDYLQSVIVQLGATIGETLAGLPGSFYLDTTIPLIGLWVVLGQMLSPMAEAPANGTSGPLENLRPVHYWRNLSDDGKRRLQFVAIFFFGGYLSMAAIIAVPWLRGDEAPESLTKDKLHAALQTALIPATEISFELSSEMGGLNSLSEKVNSAVAKLDELLNPLSGTDAANNLSSTIKIGRNRILQNWLRAFQATEKSGSELSRLGREIKNEQASALNQHLTWFETNTNAPLTIPERRDYFNSAAQGFSEQVDEFRNAIKDCRGNYDYFVSSLKSLADDSVADIEALATPARSAKKSPPDNEDASEGTAALSDSRFIIRRIFDSPSTSVACAMPTGRYRLPEIADPGMHMGPFADVARWLIKTRSLELALITGMLGFGLLGAGLSSLIRPLLKPDTEAKKGPEDVTAVVLRGLSAAIIIFLLVKGGLAVFLVGEAEPNPYVLFLSCIIGAVFWEEVWERARAALSHGGQNPPPGGGPIGGGNAGGGTTSKVTAPGAADGNANGQTGKDVDTDASATEDKSKPK